MIRLLACLLLLCYSIALGEARCDHVATHIISLAPNLTEMLVSIGAQKQLVARDLASDFPQSVLSLPIVGTYDSVNLEKILRLQPDLVLVWGQGPAPQAQAFLEEKGIQIYHADFLHLEDVAKLMLVLGCLTGHQEGASKAAKAFRKQLTELTKQHEPPLKQRVFFQLWPQPLLALGGKGFLAEALSICGVENIFAGVAQESFRVSVEKIIKADPDLILGFDEKAQNLARWQDWRGLKAVKSRRLVYIEGDLLARPGPRVLSGMADLCRRLG